MDKSTIIIGADLVPNKYNEQIFERGLAEEIVGHQLYNELKSSDIRIFNLETVIFDGDSPIQKCGPCLKAPTAVMSGIKSLNPTIVTLANNHAMDHGIDGLRSTISQLEKYEIDYLGAGENLNQASKPYFIDLDGMKVGLYACVEHEFSIASENRPGCNPIDYLEISDHIRQLKSECDYVVVLYHGGSERYRYAPPYLQKLCRKIVDCGADLIVCQHSHCVGCREEYKGSEIVYGQGNFIFHANNDYYKTSLLIKISLWKENDEIKHAINYIPINQTETGVELSIEDKKVEILNGFIKRSEEIKTPDVLTHKYGEFSEMMVNAVYYPRSLGRVGDNIVFKLLNKISGKKLGKYLFSKKQKNDLINVIECEAHKELFIHALRR